MASKRKLKKRIKALEARVAELEAHPSGETHIHYHQPQPWIEPITPYKPFKPIWIGGPYDSTTGPTFEFGQDYGNPHTDKC